MDHSSMGVGDSSMVPYLHFTGGDYLFFSIWRPTTRGEIAGACIALLLLAMVERFLAAVRVVFDSHWHNRAMAMIPAAEQPQPLKTGNENVVSSAPHVNEIRRGSRDGASTNSTPGRRLWVRTIPLFVVQHDIPRGLLFMLKMFLDYLLMLAVMTFHAAYLISIIIGLGIGETLYGRITRVH